MSTTPSPGDLCAECGLCCGGAMFDRLTVEPDEALHALALGLPLSDEGHGLCVAQPCPMLRGPLCSIYAERPRSCRAYRCETLKQLEAGEVDFAAALVRVEEAKAAARHAEAMLAGETVPRFRQRSRTASDDPARSAVAALDACLNRDFRRREQWIVDGAPA